jgi:hypothetical protein
MENTIDNVVNVFLIPYEKYGVSLWIMVTELRWFSPDVVVGCSECAIIGVPFVASMGQFD